MKAQLWFLTAAAALVAIGCDPPIRRARPSRDDGGTVDTECAGGFCAGTFDSQGLYPVAAHVPQLAVAQNGDTLGIAYFSESDVADAGYDIWYRSWTNGVVTAAERIATVDGLQGLAIAFQPSGEPAASFQGGDDDGANLASWQNSDAIVAYRSNGTWTQQVAADDGNQAGGGGPALSPVVGVYPALGFGTVPMVGGGTAVAAYLTYRDCKAGQSEMGDYRQSDMELVEGGPTVWTRRVLARGMDPGTNGWGGNPRMIMVGNQPALVSTNVQGGSTNKGINVFFDRRNLDGNWASRVTVLGVGNTFSAPSLAHNGIDTFGVAVTELQGTQRLTYQTSTNNGVSWIPPDPVWESGSGGWFPSLAYNPANDAPHIAYYFCALSLGVTEGLCPASEDELRVATRGTSSWPYQVVDPEGGFQPWLFFLSNNKRVIVYRDIDSAEMRVALEQ